MLRPRITRMFLNAFSDPQAESVISFWNSYPLDHASVHSIRCSGVLTESRLPENSYLLSESTRKASA